MNTPATRIIRIIVNGTERAIAIHPADTLVQVLREKLKLLGTKVSCEQGECGVCTVLLDGESVNSCLVFAASADGHTVQTIEGMAHNGNLDPIQQAFIDNDASQCGYCTPGMVMSTKNLLTSNSSPSLEDIQTGLSGNICRCTGYQQIINAVQDAAEVNVRTEKDGTEV